LKETAHSPAIGSAGPSGANKINAKAGTFVVSYRAPRILALSPAKVRLPEQLARIGRALQARVEAGVRTERRRPRIALASVDAEVAGEPQAVPHRLRARRKETSLPGLMTFRNLRLELPCTIADLSATGARLYVPPTSLRLIGNLEHLPNELMLALRSDRTEVPCEIRWRRTNSLGVRFKGLALPISTPRR
jgi:hypothetical protein